MFELVSRPWFFLAILQGIVLAVNFYLLAYTAQRAGVSVAVLASRLSVAIPVVLAFLFYGDSLNAVKIVGLAAALSSLYLCTATGQDFGAFTQGCVKHCRFSCSSCSGATSPC